MNKECKGCREEIELAYHYQELGFNVGFTWSYGHCFVFVLDDNGEEVIW